MIKFTSKEQLKTAVINYFNEQAKGDSDISNWDTSEITDMSRLFEYIEQKTVEPITLNWDTSNVTNMRAMFEYCKQDFILNFDTSKVTDMSYMFNCAINFNQPLNFRRHSGGGCHTAATDHSAVGNECLTALCDTSNVTNMAYMFTNATHFNQPLNFNTVNVTNMTCMFYCATNFNQPLNFHTHNVKTMTYMFAKAINFNHPIYFQSIESNDEIFKNSPMKEQTQKYILTPAYYKKLFVTYALNQVNPELLYLVDEFEEFFG